MKLLALVSALFIAACANAAQQVQQSGTVTPGHIPSWTTSGVIQDGGAATNGYVTNLGIFANGGLPSCITASTTPRANFNPASSPYSQFCEFTTMGGASGISLQSYNGAPNANFEFLINGQTYPFPGPGGGTVVGPNSSVQGDVAIFNDGGGQLLADAGGPPAFGVSTISALKALSLTGKSAGFPVRVTGYYAAGDMPSSLYTLSTSACSLNAGAGDGGSQVPSNTSNNCWLLGAQSAYDVRQWGAVASTATTTGSITASSGALSVASVSGYSAGQTIDVYGAGAAYALNAPTGVSITLENNSGTSNYCVRIVAIDADHGFGAATAEVCNAATNTAFAIPSTNSDSSDAFIQWTAPTGTAPQSYAVYTGLQGAETCQAVTHGVSWRDYAQHEGCPSWLPTAPPGSASADLLRTTVQAVNAVALSMTVSPAAVTTVSGAVVEHDATTQIQAALNSVTDTVLPCGSFHTTQGLMVNKVSGQVFEGSGRGCAALFADGTFDVVTVSSSSGTMINQQLKNMRIQAAGMANGYCTTVNGSNRVMMKDIAVTSCYNESQITDSFVGWVYNYWADTARRGDVGWYYWGTGSGVTTQAGVWDMQQVNSAAAYQGISFHIDGNAASIRTWHFGMEGAPTELVVNNAVGAAQTAIYGYHREMGFNTCWRACLQLTTATNYEFYVPYIQQVTGGSANPQAVLIGAASTSVKFIGGIITGGVNGITNNGFGTELQGTDVIDNVTANIECTAQCTDMTISGGNSHNLLTPSAGASANYGILLDAGCQFVNIAGIWKGTQANVYDQCGPSTEIVVNGIYRPLPNTVIHAAGNQSLLAASYPNLYLGTAGRPATLETSGYAGGVTYTTDTATNILAALGTAYVGQQFSIVWVNHTQQTVALAGGTGVTLSGVTTVPAASVLAGEAQLVLKGTVTNTGSPAVTLKGCSNIAGAAC